MKYRVIIKVGYYQAWFDFDSADKACVFAKMALEHSVENVDTGKAIAISLEVFDPKSKESEEE